MRYLRIKLGQSNSLSRLNKTFTNQSQTFRSSLILMSSEIFNSSCQRRRFPKREDHLTSKVSNHQSQEVDSAVIEEEVSAVEEEVDPLEAAEELHVVVVSVEAAVEIQEEVVALLLVEEVDIEFIYLN